MTSEVDEIRSRLMEFAKESSLMNKQEYITHSVCYYIKKRQNWLCNLSAEDGRAILSLGFLHKWYIQSLEG